MAHPPNSGHAPSKRGLANIRRNLMLDLSREAEKYPPYQKDCPEGLIDITSSVNALMRDEMAGHIEKLPQNISQFLEYGSVAGSAALSAAVAALVNEHFCPTETVDPACVMATNDVTALLDIVSFATCDAGEGIMYTTPAYGMFRSNLISRNGIRIVEVPCSDDFDQFSAASSDTLVQMFEAAYQRARKAGIAVRAVLLCNPCNPLGRCYSRTSLIRLAAFCAQHSLQLISDEIYALSVTASDPELDGFTSVLNLGHESGLSPQSIHVLYGASKDWGLGGLRLGFLVTHNALFKEACRRLGMFTWVSSYSDLVFTATISDPAFVARYVCTYRQRLEKARQFATGFLDEHGIPYHRANAGVFLWIDLSQWSSLLDICGAVKESRDVRLTRFLMEKKAIYLEPGEASQSNTVKFLFIY